MLKYPIVVIDDDPVSEGTMTIREPHGIVSLIEIELPNPLRAIFDPERTVDVPLQFTLKGQYKDAGGKNVHTWTILGVLEGFEGFRVVGYVTYSMRTDMGMRASYPVVTSSLGIVDAEGDWARINIDGMIEGAEVTPLPIVQPKGDPTKGPVINPPVTPISPKR